ncbi:MAG: cytochrome c oxidase accessory protein CcoG [Gammaproteobacteria bacterium]|jgi:cytochrome c oxidase accessory protein FixG|nr:cytochrome c oxidase accessory protein CcoG [Gammaproteobacteria bacterium]
MTTPHSDSVQSYLYERAQKIYPRQVTGIFAMWRTIAVIVLMGIYYGLPWLTWDGRQAILFDLPARKFYLFGLVLWPQDLVYLTFLLALAAFALFFFTALAGRLWCGFACPQTVWTEVFLWIERKIEGTRQQQMKLAEMPWDARKLRIKGTKHVLWILLSLYTGFTFVGYFSPIQDLATRIAVWHLGPWESFWVLFYGFATWGNAGFMREQVCLYMCPYARFQSAMFDADTLVITYDGKRGEQRGARSRKDTSFRERGLGDCIDCTMCVQVCPTGIDIRDGLQYECIACAACIDACDGVMDKIGYPRGLIRYSTERELEGKKTRLLRPRVVIYSLILLGLFVLFGFMLNQREPIGLDVIRDRNSLYREAPDGRIENVYVLKLLNMDRQPHRYLLSIEGLEHGQLYRDGGDLDVPGGEVLEFPVRIRLAEEFIANRSSSFHFVMQAEDAPRLRAREEARFLGPSR